MKDFKLNFEGYDVYDNTRGALERYILNGYEPGSFVCAVLRNDLFDAVARADRWNKQTLSEVVRWITNNAPNLCYGSDRLYEAWINDEGMRRTQWVTEYEKQYVWKTLKEDY